MHLKLNSMLLCIFVTMTLVSVEAKGNLIVIPSGCAAACPPGDKLLCAKNTVTQGLGTFESDCIFGRFNSCHRTLESKYLTNEHAPTI